MHRLFTTFIGSFGVETVDSETRIWGAFELEPK